MPTANNEKEQLVLDFFAAIASAGDLVFIERVDTMRRVDNSTIVDFRVTGYWRSGTARSTATPTIRTAWAPPPSSSPWGTGDGSRTGRRLIQQTGRGMARTLTTPGRNLEPDRRFNR
jgi:hypothetical protein